MSRTFDEQQVLAMELAAARAWPAAREAQIDGWRARLSGGGSRRGNSVLPLAYTGRDLDAAITAVEGHYRAQRTRSYFQISSISHPVDLDGVLEARGYTYEEPCLLMAKGLTATRMPDNVVVSQSADAAWLAIYTAPLDATRKAAAPAVLETVPRERAFLLVMRDGAPLTSALAVLSPDGIVLVECVATRPDVRRAGGAQVVMDALEAWAFQNGAHTAALQVVLNNVPARTLYERRGYVEASRYHYRWRDVA